MLSINYNIYSFFIIIHNIDHKQPEGFLKVFLVLVQTVALGRTGHKKLLQFLMVSPTPIKHPSENKPMIGQISLCLALGSQVLVGLPVPVPEGANSNGKTSQGQLLALLNPLKPLNPNGEIFKHLFAILPVCLSAHPCPDSVASSAGAQRAEKTHKFCLLW